MITTDDCREFIAKFMQDHPEILDTTFFRPGDDQSERAEMLAAATNPKNWKRRSKTKFTSSWRWDKEGEGQLVPVFSEGFSVNRHIESDKSMLGNDVAWVRGFDCDPFDGQFAFEVIEAKDGTLYLGSYIGD